MDTILDKEELFLVDLCWGQPDPNNCKMLNPSLLIEASHKHKLMPLLISFLESGNIKFELDEKYDMVMRRYQEERKFWISILKILDAQSSILKEDFFLLKGFSFENNYPNAMDRFAIDMDVLLVNEQSFWAVMDVLKNNGIEMPGMFLLFHSFVDVNLEGICRLCISEEKVIGGLELHLRRFQATQRTWIHVDQLDLVNNFDQLVIDGVTVKTPSQADSFLIYLYEMITREKLSIRDYYDVFHLTSKAMSFDAKANLNKKIIELGLAASLVKVNQGFIALGIHPPPLFREIFESHNLQSSIHPLVCHEKQFFRNMGLFISTKIKTTNYLRRKLDRWIDHNKFIFLLRFFDYKKVTELLFRIGLPTYCIEVFPLNREEAILSKARLIKKNNDLIYIMGANNFLTDKDLASIESS